jgi:hypothetical protein
MKLLLRLRHKEYPQNKEDWHENELGNIFVKSDCPTNYPKYSEHTLSRIEALRQYVLMTSQEEGWELVTDLGWHDFVEAIINTEDKSREE